MPTLAVKVNAELADAVREIVESYGATVSDLLRPFVEAVALDRRWPIVEGDRVIGYVYLLPFCSDHDPLEHDHEVPA